MLTAERLRELLDYDQETGRLTNKVSRGASAPAGQLAGSKFRYPDGYPRVTINGKMYLAHRLAWLYVTGVWPVAQIDHINGVSDDNRFANLREASASENSRNSKLPTSNTSGFKGVCRHRKGWQATIRIDGRTVYLGMFKTPEAAHAAYCAAAREHHGEFARYA
jgi:hypothetical protein